jgi:hypothetical protein
MHAKNGASLLSDMDGYWPDIDMARLELLMHACSGPKPCGDHGTLGCMQ